MRNIIVCIMIVLFAACASTYGLRYPPSRWIRDDDRRPVELSKLKITKTPAELSDTYLGTVNKMLTFSETVSDITTAPVKGHEEAINTNNFDEVADSSWFTNRMGRFGRLDNDGRAFAMPRRLDVVDAKLDPQNSRFVVKDADGTHYYLKFDQPGKPEMLTGSELMVSAFLHNIGFNTFQQQIVHIRPSDIALTDGSIVHLKDGNVKKMNEDDLKDFFSSLDKGKNGLYRGVIMKQIKDTKPMGPFSLSWMRSGDPNDRMPHSERREFRGLMVFSAFLALNKIDDQNTMDIFVPTDEGRGYIDHYLFDLAFNLTTVMVKPQEKETGEYRRAVGNIFTLGFYDPYWSQGEATPPAPTTSIAADGFDPASWKPSFMSPGFKKLTKRDALWAARILASFSDDDIRKVVKQARFTDPKLERYTADNLIGRRDKICRYWFSQLNPLDDFALSRTDGGFLFGFTDLSVAKGYEDPKTSAYRLMVRDTRADVYLTKWMENSDTSFIIPDAAVNRMKNGETYTVQVQSRHAHDKWWYPSVDVFIKKDPGTLKLLGLNRRYSH